jgi:hypothetical protein
MSGFSELIKNFDKTRDYVRDFFIYGFKVRNDFERKSSRTYDDEKRRVESWLGNYVRYDDSQRGRQISITVDSGHISENPLYQAYHSKSFTDNDIKLHFLIADILADGNRLCLKEIVNHLNEEYEQFFGRTFADSPEIDGRVWIASDEPILEGSFVKVQIDGMIDGDLSGFLVEE